jgi:hypothetical protein
MSNNFTPVTQGGKILDIDLVFGRISSTIQIVPLNENQRDPDEITGVAGCVRALHRPVVHPKETAGEEGCAAYLLHELWVEFFYAHEDN